MSTGGVIAIALIALLIGWLLGVLSTRRRDDSTQPPEVLDPLPRAILAETRSGYAILDAEQHVLLSNRRAAELDVVRAGFAAPAIAEAAERALVSGEPVDVDLTDRRLRGGPNAVHAEVRAMGEDLVLVIAADESAAVRVEAVRRDFVANVSHELKTPIGSVLLLAEAVLDASDDPETVRHFAGKIVHESNRLSTLVSELMALSRLQAGAEALDLVPIPVDSVIDEVINRSATIAVAAATEVSAAGTEQLVVRGDRTLLVTALTNLVENAIHHSPAGTPVSIDRRLRNDMVEIAVTDRGTGIPLAQQERVFERFFRGDPARSRATGGTGLGLAIVKHVAANHGGEVTLWSRVGTGSTFTLRLPADPSTPRPSPETATQTTAVGLPSTSDSPDGGNPDNVRMESTRSSSR